MGDCRFDDILAVCLRIEKLLVLDIYKSDELYSCDNYIEDKKYTFLGLFENLDKHLRTSKTFQKLKFWPL